MKISILIDNNTLIDRYFKGEPGLSFLIEADDVKILFDTAYSDAFIENAAKMHKNIMDLDYIVLSHGHLDHTWGLEPLSRKFIENIFENKLSLKRPKLIAHPDVFAAKYIDGNPIGINVSRDFIESVFNLKLKKETYWLNDKFAFLGEIPRKFDFENKEAIGVIKKGGVEKDDYLLDDSALIYKGEDGLIIITGCSHAGICNIVEHAKKISGIDKVKYIIGGLHLLDPDKNTLKKTVDYLAEENLEVLYPCHCTNLNSKLELSKKINVEEVGAGLELSFK